MKATQRLHEAGQSLWLDHITRALLASGTLARYVKELGEEERDAPEGGLRMSAGVRPLTERPAWNALQRHTDDPPVVDETAGD